MKIIKEVQDNLYTLIENKRKVGRMSLDKDTFVRFLNTINYINSLGEDDTMINNVPMSDWKISPFFSFLIYPEKVSVTNARGEVDLISRPVVDASKEPTMSLSEFRSVHDVMSTLMRSNASEVLISELRRPVTLSNVINRLTTDGVFTTMSEDVGHFPILVKHEFVKPKLNIYDVNESVSEKFRAIIDSLSSK